MRRLRWAPRWAHKKHGRLVVSRQNDGDLMYVPGTLWAAAHHRIPLLSVMRNNRAYHQEVMHLQRMANRYQRGADGANTSIGTKIEDPNIDYAAMARSMGVYGEGPMTNPNDLRPALARAIEAVEGGRGCPRGRGVAASLRGSGRQQGSVEGHIGPRSPKAASSEADPCPDAVGVIHG